MHLERFGTVALAGICFAVIFCVFFFCCCSNKISRTQNDLPFNGNRADCSTEKANENISEVCKQQSAITEGGISDEDGKGVLGSGPVGSYEPYPWDIVPFTDPRTGETYDIIDGRVIIAFQNPPVIPEVDPNYFDEIVSYDDPYYDDFRDGYAAVIGDPEVDLFIANENLVVFSEWTPLRGIAAFLPEGQSVEDAVLNWPIEYPDLVLAVDPDGVIKFDEWPYSDPNDDAWFYQWNLNPINIHNSPYHINIQEAWRQGYFGWPCEIIAVLDTGVQRGHRDVDARLLPDGINVGDNFWHGTIAGAGAGQPRTVLLEESQANAQNLGHGTCVAGIICSGINNDGNGIIDDLDIAGISYANYVLPVAIDARSSGIFSGASFTSCTAMVNAYVAIGIVKGIYWNFTGIWPFPRYNIEVVNCSYGWEHSVLYERVLVGKLSRYMLFVCSAGNDRLDDVWHFPASRQDTLAVGSYSWDGERDWSNYDDWVDVLAPGKRICTPDMLGFTQNGYWLGYQLYYPYHTVFGATSAAAPHASAVAAMISSEYRNVTPQQMRLRIKNNTVLDLEWDELAIGRLDALASLS